jgi:hypothetical protein
MIETHYGSFTVVVRYLQTMEYLTVVILPPTLLPPPSDPDSYGFGGANHSQ